MRNDSRPAAMLLTLLCVGCATAPQPNVDARAASAPTRATSEQKIVPPAASEQAAATPMEPPAAEPERTQPTPAPEASGQADAAAVARQKLAVLRVQAGALITQVNGDPKIHCIRPDCTIPLPAGTHRFTVGYKDTATRAGSKVTYASMYPRVVEVTLKPGHHYSVTASGRYSHKWWIAIEDQTTKKVVYDDRVRSKGEKEQTEPPTSSAASRP